MKKMFLGVFAQEENVIAAARACRESGYSVHDVYSSHPLHGLDEAMNLRPSPLPRLCFCFGAAGLLLALAGEYWMGSFDWPLDIGGKPANSLPAYLPIAFELTVLCAGLGTAASLFVLARLRPARKEWAPDGRVTSDTFVLALSVEDPAFDRCRAETLMHHHGAHAIRTIPEDGR